MREVSNYNRDFAKLTLEAYQKNRLIHRGQAEVKYRYFYLRVFRNRDNPHMISPNKPISADLDRAPKSNNKEVRPATVAWTQNEDEALANAVFTYMQNPNMMTPNFRSIQPFVATRDAAQCANRYITLEKHYFV